MAVKHLQLVSIPVTDQDRSRDFYVNVLGFDVITDMPMGPGRRWVQVAPRGAQTSITLVTDFETMPPGSVKGTVLETDNLEGDIATFQTRGLAIEGAIEEAPWGRWVTFSDPDGNGIVLQATTPTGR